MGRDLNFSRKECIHYFESVHTEFYLLRISPYSDQKKSAFEHFLHSESLVNEEIKL